MSKSFFCFLIVLLAAVPYAAGNPSLLKTVGSAYGRVGADAKHQAIALRWYRAAAAGGDAEAMLIMGIEFYRGVAVRRDYAQAVIWWKRAAGHGDSDAELMLSNAYCEGRGVAANPVESLRWWQLAAAHGNFAFGAVPPRCQSPPAPAIPDSGRMPGDRI